MAYDGHHMDDSSGGRSWTGQPLKITPLIFDTPGLLLSIYTLLHKLPFHRLSLHAGATPHGAEYRVWGIHAIDNVLPWTLGLSSVFETPLATFRNAEWRLDPRVAWPSTWAKDRQPLTSLENGYPIGPTVASSSCRVTRCCKLSNLLCIRSLSCDWILVAKTAPLIVQNSEQLVLEPWEQFLKQMTRSIKATLVSYAQLKTFQMFL